MKKRESVGEIGDNGESGQRLRFGRDFGLKGIVGKNFIAVPEDGEVEGAVFFEKRFAIGHLADLIVLAFDAVGEGLGIFVVRPDHGNLDASFFVEFGPHFGNLLFLEPGLSDGSVRGAAAADFQPGAVLIDQLFHANDFQMASLDFSSGSGKGHFHEAGGDKIGIHLEAHPAAGDVLDGDAVFAFFIGADISDAGEIPQYVGFETLFGAFLAESFFAVRRGIFFQKVDAFGDFFGNRDQLLQGALLDKTVEFRVIHGLAHCPARDAESLCR